MTELLDWNSNRDMWIRVLKKQTGKSLEHWNQRVSDQNITDEAALRAWLSEKAVTGYAATLLVMEHFGYPDWITASADELIEDQYADRQHLKPIFDAILHAVSELGDFMIQTRKTYVSLLTPRRTFARVRPTTKNRLDIGLRLEGREPSGRLQPSNFQQTMKVQIGLSTLEDLDEEALGWLQLAYEENS